ncbi:type IV toxin-antitoxin system AbiEi family antitoxin domain-containing protein [Adlercreutzia caecimuris]|jgi:predicted transcriptional regulator of viral defense system|uniref:AbiEi antitoxin C-terminal domain-containing protein n=2 Tax=Adlercreutzia caecimuris TaxID=671266 RepID=R9L0V5_9ACTN|nr:hypothetical protein [Adlercreutzia caecimuris]EOS52439.1 hypothetical protein C811_00469 [Adlercreutzia caecimuris B7]MCR2036467.1 hypothetical protein [Adlercreutzia caecimuris]
MVKTTKMIREELSSFADPANKVARMVREGRLTPIIRGLYETEATASPWSLAGCIYGPSYISFESALSFHGLIPEGVRAVTSATFEKGKAKAYDTPFGSFLFRDVPAEAFPYGIDVKGPANAPFRIATPEKALCDKLYTMSPVTSCGGLEALLYDDLRIDRGDLAALDVDDVAFLAEKYRSRNVRRLARYLKEGSGR